MKTDTLSIDNSTTLVDLFQGRVRQSANAIAYCQFEQASQSWVEYSWQQTANDVAIWQAALGQYQLTIGDRVAIMVKNSREWVIFEQACLGLGLVVVPLYINDNADNVTYILNNAEAKILFIDGDEQWQELSQTADQFESIQLIISLQATSSKDDSRLVSVKDWLPTGNFEIQKKPLDAAALATIVYTSGTTGKPKGVMLSHQNIAINTSSALQTVNVFPEDSFLSFLPLSHMLERTGGYYLPMVAGSKVSFSRGIPVLAEDLLTVKPTCLISVPRIYERVYGKIMEGLEEKSAVAGFLFKSAIDVGWYQFNYLQGRASWHPKLLLWPLLNKLVATKIMAKLGGRLRIAITAGAAISPKVSELFIGLGLPLLQGYGLTESSPVLTVNTLEKNDPASVGQVVPSVQIKRTDEGELIAKGPNIMLGYWKNEQATSEVIDQDGWFHTGDKFEKKDDFIYISGRIKEIIVLSNGEKMPPNDMEIAASLHPCFEQVMIHGEARPYPIALIVLEPEQWAKHAKKEGLEGLALDDEKVEKYLVDNLAILLKNFPGYAIVRRATCTLEPWTVENGMLTPTLKTKRKIISENYADSIERLYEGH